MARTVSTTLYDLLVGSVITAALVPVLVQYTRDERQLWRVASAVFSLATVLLALVTAGLMLAPEAVATVLASGSRPTDGS